MAPEVILILQFPSESGRAGPCDRCIVRQKDRCSLIEEFLQTEIVYNDHLVSLREVGRFPATTKPRVVILKLVAHNFKISISAQS